VTLPTIRAELGEVSRFHGVDQVIAYAGLEPRTRQSGTRMGQKLLVLSWAWRAAAMPSRFSVVVAVRCRAEWRERYQRRLSRGRAKKEAFTILSRSRLTIIYHLLRTGTSYDPACVVSPRTGS
jgi:transposase